jgi:hypothetical protein
VYIVYVITTTTTTTPISAPILNANGPITWIPGSQQTGITTESAPSTVSGSSITNGTLSCEPIPGTTNLFCSLAGSGTRATDPPRRTHMKLSCTLAAPKTTANHKAKGKSKHTQRPAKRKRVTARTTSTHAPRRSQKHSQRHGRSRVTLVCNSV